MSNELTYGGKPHECWKVVPLVVSYTPLDKGLSICSNCLMTVDSEEDKKHYVPDYESNKKDSKAE